MRKTLYIILAIFLALPLMAANNYIVVIDAGHGGKDPGAVGKISQEKDLNLRLALSTGKLIEQRFSDVKVVYTRSTDVFIPLQTRADIANKNKANLFISIHTNASESKDAKGVETFILGTEKMEKNLDVAMRENAVMKLEADYKTTYHGFDPNSIDSYIMFELMQNSYMDQSLQFATQIQNRFVNSLNRYDRGVRQAAFWVLLKTACPSVLFEMGFISNPEEEAFLNTDSAMNSMAEHLVDAFAAYTHRNAANVQPATSEPQNAGASTQLGQTQSREIVSNTDSRASQEPVENITPPSGEMKTYFAIQICASRTPLQPNDERLKGQKAEMVKIGDWYKYYVEADVERAKVAEKLPEYKKIFPDCWIIKFEK